MVSKKAEREETSMAKEIERKFLVDMVNGKLLHRKSTISRIEQTYLRAFEGERRVRKRTTDNIVDFFYTEKFGTGLTRVENERKISEKEFNELMKEADQNLHTVKKVRYTFSYKKQIFELDVYDFCSTHATMEIELHDENQTIQLPPFVHILKEITEDKRFKNRKLAETLIIPVE